MATMPTISPLLPAGLESRRPGTVCGYGFYAERAMSLGLSSARRRGQSTGSA